jgi:hypothetical protein
LVLASIQLVDLHETKILTQEIAHRASFLPLPVQPPLAAWIDQAVTGNFSKTSGRHYLSGSLLADDGR